MRWVAVLLLFFMALPANAATVDRKTSANNYALYSFMNGCKEAYYNEFELGLLRPDQIPRLKKHTQDACLCMGRALFTQRSGSAVLQFTQSYYGSGMFNPQDTVAMTYATGGERATILAFLNDAKVRESCQYFGVFR